MIYIFTQIKLGFGNHYPFDQTNIEIEFSVSKKNCDHDRPIDD